MTVGRVEEGDQGEEKIDGPLMMQAKYADKPSSVVKDIPGMRGLLEWHLLEC